jgi:hypothetical protein
LVFLFIIFDPLLAWSLSVISIFGDQAVQIGVMNTLYGYLNNPRNGTWFLAGIRLSPELTLFQSASTFVC